MRQFILAAAVCAGLAAAPAYQHPAPDRIEIADGIFLFTTKPYGDVGLDGNSIAITSRDGVLVFDTNGTPAAAAAVLAEIRRITPQPVRFIVNSHWHWDHWYGTESYTAAYPEVRIIAHEKTRTMMMGPALAFNRPGIEVDLPRYIERLEQKAASDPGAAPPTLDADRFFLAQKRGVHHTFPNVTYERAMDLYFGGRHVRVLHGDRAVTPGDTFLYLPDEKIVVTGDLLVNPISFALSCYPSGWLHTLEQIDALDASVIVPGHGAPLRDKTLLHATMAVFRELLAQGAAAKARGLDADQARAEILPRLHDLMMPITHDDPALNQAFSVQLVDWFLHRVYDELNGPMSDEIAPIPKA